MKAGSQELPQLLSPPASHTYNHLLFDPIAYDHHTRRRYLPSSHGLLWDNIHSVFIKAAIELGKQTPLTSSGMEGSQRSDTEESKVKRWPFFLVLIITNTSDSHSRLYWAAFLKRLFLSLLLCWVLAWMLSDRRLLLN